MATTIISYEEQTRGWLARIASLSDASLQAVHYLQLKRQLQNYCRVAVVDFDQQAVQEFMTLRQAKLRLGTMDLKIAAIALAHRATLLTRNSSDFGKVPNLTIEDWSI
ncbi:type II toxin-antitoxin system VapC family toxin [Armatimonas sp.]|uniref:type II toxin-antitoxin system VapC family toxin n=1 Tax=Armatimonas sp. TaxID=1872638 RepID=UPI003753D1BE